MRSLYALAFISHKDSCFSHSAMKASFTSILFASTFDTRIFSLLHPLKSSVGLLKILKNQSVNHQSITFLSLYLIFVILSSKI